MSPMLEFGWILMFASVAYASWCGSIPERQGAAIIAAWYLADPSYHAIFGPPQFRFVDPSHVVMDTAETLALGYVALRANRMWPLWAAAAELTALSGHLALAINPVGLQRAYYAVTQLTIYPQLAALLLGTLAHRRRLRRTGPYRDWRTTP